MAFEPSRNLHTVAINLPEIYMRIVLWQIAINLLEIYIRMAILWQIAITVMGNCHNAYGNLPYHTD